MTEAERCRQEIEQAEAAVIERCGFGEYCWLQDWREELALIDFEVSATQLAVGTVGTF